jgi:hypothetical protein
MHCDMCRSVMVLPMMKWIVPVLVLLLAFILFWAIGCYNRLQALRASALQSLAQHAAAVSARNAVIDTLCKSLSSNLQHERAVFSEVDAALHRNTALAEAANLARGAPDAMQAYAHSERELVRQVKTLKDIHDIYPELSVNAQLVAEWNSFAGAMSRCRFSGEQFNDYAHKLNTALGEAPASQLAQMMNLRSLQAMPLHEPLPLQALSTQADLL